MTEPRSDGRSGPDVRRFVEVLDRHRVEYVLVGGIAARAHGAERLTQDLDCLARRTQDNLERLATAMREVNARLRVHGLSDEEAAELPVVIDGARLGQMEISTWQTDAGAFDVLADMPDRTGRHRGYDDLATRSSTVEYEGIAIRVASLDDVIASKEWADRPKDRTALPELRRLLDATGDSET
jgi:hypothetical protein